MLLLLAVLVISSMSLCFFDHNSHHGRWLIAEAMVLLLSADDSDDHVGLPHWKDVVASWGDCKPPMPTMKKAVTVPGSPQIISEGASGSIQSSTNCVIPAAAPAGQCLTSSAGVFPEQDTSKRDSTVDTPANMSSPQEHSTQQANSAAPLVAQSPNQQSRLQQKKNVDSQAASPGLAGSSNASHASKHSTAQPSVTTSSSDFSPAESNMQPSSGSVSPASQTETCTAVTCTGNDRHAEVQKTCSSQQPTAGTQAAYKPPTEATDHGSGSKVLGNKQSLQLLRQNSSQLKAAIAAIQVQMQHSGSDITHQLTCKSPQSAGSSPPGSPQGVLGKPASEGAGHADLQHSPALSDLSTAAHSPNVATTRQRVVEPVMDVLYNTMMASSSVPGPSKAVHAACASQPAAGAALSPKWSADGNLDASHNMHAQQGTKLQPVSIRSSNSSSVATNSTMHQQQAVQPTNRSMQVCHGLPSERQPYTISPARPATATQFDRQQPVGRQNNTLYPTSTTMETAGAAACSTSSYLMQHLQQQLPILQGGMPSKPALLQYPNTSLPQHNQQGSSGMLYMSGGSSHSTQTEGGSPTGLMGFSPTSMLSGNSSTSVMGHSPNSILGNSPTAFLSSMDGGSPRSLLGRQAFSNSGELGMSADASMGRGYGVRSAYSQMLQHPRVSEQAVQGAVSLGSDMMMGQVDGGSPHAALLGMQADYPPGLLTVQQVKAAGQHYQHTALLGGLDGNSPTSLDSGMVSMNGGGTYASGSGVGGDSPLAMHMSRRGSHASLFGGSPASSVYGGTPPGGSPRVGDTSQQPMLGGGGFSNGNMYDALLLQRQQQVVLQQSQQQQQQRLLMQQHESQAQLQQAQGMAVAAAAASSTAAQLQLFAQQQQAQAVALEKAVAAANAAAVVAEEQANMAGMLQGMQLQHGSFTQGDLQLGGHGYMQQQQQQQQIPRHGPYTDNAGCLSAFSAAASNLNPLSMTGYAAVADQQAMQRLQHGSGQLSDIPGDGLYVMTDPYLGFDASNQLPTDPNGYRHQRSASKKRMGYADGTMMSCYMDGSCTPPAPRPDFRCELCGLSCNSALTLQQHLSSKRHLLRAAHAAMANVSQAADQLELGEGLRGADGSSAAGQPLTYIGPNAAVQSYCHQEITVELNHAVTTLLQQVKAFQDRAMAKNMLKVSSTAW